MVALRVRDQCMRRVELIPVGMCTRTARASPLKAFGHPERIVGGGDDMFRNCCTTVPDWFRRDVAGDAGCALPWNPTGGFPPWRLGAAIPPGVGRPWRHVQREKRNLNNS
jgi:hypothetical protein